VPRDSRSPMARSDDFEAFGGQERSFEPDQTAWEFAVRGRGDLASRVSRFRDTPSPACEWDLPGNGSVGLPVTSRHAVPPGAPVVLV
jgi:hypothetical protein